MSIEDKLEIQELTSRYANEMDDTDLDAWMETWDIDGSWKGGLGEFKGTQKLKELFSVLGDRIKDRRHVMTNFVVTVTGDQAVQRSYMLVFDRVNEPRLIASGVYNDRLIRTGGTWKFIERSVSLDPSFRP